MRTALTILALLISTAPPARFDHPYTSGPVYVYYIPQVNLQLWCYDLFAKYNLHISTSDQQYGCSVLDHKSKVCVILSMRETIDGTTPEDVVRHELGHCNGWSKDHEY